MRGRRARSRLNNDDLRLLRRNGDGSAAGGDAEARAELVVGAAARPDAEPDESQDDDERNTTDGNTGDFNVAQRIRGRNDDARNDAQNLDGNIRVDSNVVSELTVGIATPALHRVAGERGAIELVTRGD